ncbi:phosphoserine transaminase [Malassezia cuniculi]|uniref:phosphoserine transaminase n=1 Tax=Malassezia cuniculi TaxID=948313 RepID=A0AAF0J6N1_9BASI|nr:phosphoserine transaminase [Malassezia cuniculi]
MTREQTINLGAGPSTLPTSVLTEAARDILDYQGTGMGVIELSHRSSTFQNLLKQTENDLRKLADIPDEYAVLFVQGGGTDQFSATLLNLLAAYASRNPDAPTPAVDYVVSGAWSNKAIKEAQRLFPRVNVACDVRKNIGDASQPIPRPSQWNLSQDAALLYYCDNETIHGLEFPVDFIQELPEDYRKRVPIVADCSSNILSRPVNIRDHGIVFFGAQKNIGPSGLTIVVVRRDLVVDPDALQAQYLPPIPTMLVYKNMLDNGSLYNTPPMFPIYVSGLVFQKLLAEGGVPSITKVNQDKADAVYGALLASPNVYRLNVAHADFRSKMNITFRVLGEDGEPSEEAEAAFIKLCGEHHIVQIKGHRSVGGVRTSIYNATSLEQAQTLASVINKFAGK